jgi:ubiquinone/menaquinone biosynthesis C-methylase UbiE
MPQSSAESVFGQRASYYTTSATHTDRDVLDAVVRLAQPQAHEVALDVGTGTGHTALALAPHLRFVIGSDVTPEMLKEAQTLAHQRSIGNVAWHLADAHALPYAAASFAVVTCRRAAHHFADIAGALSEMHRVLPTGGRLIIDDRSAPEDDKVDEIMHQLDGLHDPSHVRQYRPSAWADLLQRAGFVVESSVTYVQHRPLSSLTHLVPQAQVDQIEALVAGLSPHAREVMDVRTAAGTAHLNHWYLLLSARKEL